VTRHHFLALALARSYLGSVIAMATSCLPEIDSDSDSDPEGKAAGLLSPDFFVGSLIDRSRAVCWIDRLQIAYAETLHEAFCIVDFATGP